MKLNKTLAVVAVAATLSLTACSTPDMLNAAVATNTYNELDMGYKDAVDNINALCADNRINELDCVKIRENLAVLDNLRRSINDLKSKNNEYVRKVVDLHNIHAYYASGKIAWDNIRELLEAQNLNKEEVLTLIKYDEKGKLLANSIEQLIESAREGDRKNYATMIGLLIDLFGIAAKASVAL